MEEKGKLLVTLRVSLTKYKMKLPSSAQTLRQLLVI